jgi:acetate---CoA ligase (ADP-forming)
VLASAARAAPGAAAPPPRAADGVRAASARRLLEPARGRPFTLETMAKSVLRLYGIPTVREAVVHSRQEAAAAAAEFGPMVVMKVLSYQLAHKSEAGAVRTGIAGPSAAAQAYDDLLANVAAYDTSVQAEGVVVQASVDARLEVMCGMYRDPAFGPMVSAGLGGLQVELLGGPAMLRAPFAAGQARTLVAGLCDGHITDSRRGLTPRQADELAQVMVGVAALAADLPEVSSVDLNPLRAGQDHLCAVDALLVLTSDEGGAA